MSNATPGKGLSTLVAILTNNKFEEFQNLTKKSKPDSEIIDFKRSQPFNMLEFIERTAVLKALGYLLINEISICNEECSHCHNKASVTLIYGLNNSMEDTHDFDLCLECFHAVKTTPIYGQVDK